VTDAAEIEAELEARLGDVIAERYRLDKILGVGGMGAVYQAHHLLLKQDVAVKILHTHLSANEDIAMRFDREGQSAARLAHPNIIDIKDVGTTSSGLKYMVMPVLHGDELVAKLGAPIDPDDALVLIDQIFAGLEHAHDRGVIHRDLKPENVFVTRDHENNEVLKLVDFGIAKMLGDELSGEALAQAKAPLTRVGLIFGTPQYMSPEQATGVEVDARTDLYSAGTILFEMLTGRPPFENDDPMALARMQVTVAAPSLTKLVPAEVATIVERLLNKNRDERYSSAHEVRVAISHARDQLASPGGLANIDVGNPEDRAARGVHTFAALAVEPDSSAVSPLARLMAQPPLHLFAGALGTVLSLSLLFWVTSSDEPTNQSKTGDAPSVGRATNTEVEHATDAEISPIRKALLAKNPDDALVLIRPLRDRFPEDPTLLWFEGRSLSLQRGKQSLALARYADALERDSELMNDQEFYAEIYALLGQRRLRDEAVNVAVQRMGKHGHKFLLERVNDEEPRRALAYIDRHRALDELGGDPESLGLINGPLNLARDLWQARTAPSPCEAFALALGDIYSAPSGYYLLPLRKAKLPSVEEGRDAVVCPPLAGQLAALLLDHEVMFGDFSSRDEERASSTRTRKKRESSNSRGRKSTQDQAKDEGDEDSPEDGKTKNKRRGNFFQKFGNSFNR